MKVRVKQLSVGYLRWAASQPSPVARGQGLEWSFAGADCGSPEQEPSTQCHRETSEQSNKSTGEHTVRTCESECL